jgi:hypothetical protein
MLVMPTEHSITRLSETTVEALRRAYEFQPESYEELVALRGIGPKAIRALALVSELIYGTAPSWKDPAKYSFAHGGKDGIPYPVDRRTYHKTIEIIENEPRRQASERTKRPKPSRGCTSSSEANNYFLGSQVSSPTTSVYRLRFSKSTGLRIRGFPSPSASTLLSTD